MVIIENIKDLKVVISAARSKGKSVGLVPTMGALHAGHASLVERSVKENDVTIVSIFVNPTQFNDKKDLANYPRTLNEDTEILRKIGADIAFAPTAQEMYPEPDTRMFDYPPVTSVMEGPRRPGHFNGVCQIVSKLFYITQPDRAYFGEKDFQQIAVIRCMVKDLKLPIQICPCPIVREESGLALSSRNTLLSTEEKILATNIYRILSFSRFYAQNHTVKETKELVIDLLDSLEGLEVEYFEIVNGETLQNISSWSETDYVVGCITVYCGAIPVRLIDNIRYK